MKKLVSFSKEPLQIAQTAREGQTSERSEVQPSGFSNTSNNYLSLAFLSIFIFLFLGFLLFKKKSQEVRLSIFASLFLGCLLAIYTSIQISAQSLIGRQKETESNELEQEPIVTQIDTTKSSNFEDKEANKTNNNETKKKSLNKQEENSPKNNSDRKETITAEAKDPEKDDDKKVEDEEKSRKTLEDKQIEKPANNNPNISRTPVSQSQNLGQSSSQTVTSPQNRIVSTTGTSNFSTTNQINSLASTQPSRDRSISANVQTSLFRPILKLGDRGFDVTLLQTILNELGYYTLSIDGDYGYSTELAVQNFQQQNNLLADGIVGFSTCNILRVKSKNTEIQCSSQQLTTSN
ncbi:MAG: peptidoglycan-binding domain-containing protein [Cyanobacteria bacterium P01_E01_bin.42]